MRAVRTNPAVVEEMSADEQALMDADQSAPAVEVPQGDAVGQDQGGGADEPIEGAEGQAAPDGQPQKMVPLAALHEERQRRQDYEKQLAEERRTKQLLEERTNLILQRFNQQQALAPQGQQQAPTLPALDADPVGHILGRQAQTEALLGQIVQAVVGQDQRVQATDTQRSLQQHAAIAENEFARANPDYPAAASYLLEARRKDLVECGWYEPGEIQQMLVAEATQLAATALSRGENPAAVVYRLSKGRGYAAPAAAAGDQQQDANGGATSAQGVANGAERLQTVARGQQASRSIGQVRGQGPVPLTIERMLSLSDKDYLAALETPEGRALLG